MTAPTLGVLITYHNERDLLRECIASFLSQDHCPDEILIHDDASEAPAEAYLPGGFHGTILHTAENRGPARARNVLWRESHCDFVHFHDADDRVLPGWSSHVRALMTPGTEAIFTEIQSRDSTHLVSNEVLGLRRLNSKSDLVRFCLQGAMLVPAGTYRRSLVESIGGYRKELWQAEDFDFHVRLAAKLMSGAPGDFRYRVIIQPLVEILLRPESRSQDGKRVWSDGVKALESLTTELPSAYRGDLSEAAARMGSQLFRLGAIQEAQHAFGCAAQWGTPTFDGQGRLYRWVATHWGPERAEILGRWYRQAVPNLLREELREVSERKSA